MSWTIKTLGDVVDLKRGFDLPASQRVGGDFPIYSSSGLTGTHNDYAVKGPCVITGRYGTIGKVFYSSGDCWPLNTALYSCDFKGNNPRFIFYLLQIVPWREYATASAVPGINRNHVNTHEMAIPDSETQERIVNLLDSFTDKIALNNRINGYLEELFDSCFKQSLNMVDETWDTASLLDIADYKNGLAMQKFRPNIGDKGLPVLKIRELGQESCGKDAERCRSDIDESVTVHDGDLVFSWSGTLLLRFWAGGDAGLNQHLFKVTSEVYPSWFYYAWTKHHLARFTMLAKDRATTMGHIKRSALEESEVLLPPKEKLTMQTKCMQPIIDQVIANKIEVRKLAALRDALLPKLMSGEIEVSKIDLTQLNSHLSGC